MKRICTICARSGSKGIPNKNIRDLNGKPLLAYSVGSAIESGLFDRVVVTSDSEEYIDIAIRIGAPETVHRPVELAADNVSKISSIRHAVKELEKKYNEAYKTIVDLDVTSPLRNIEDIVGAVTLLESEGLDSVITGAKSRRSPYCNIVEPDDESFMKISKTINGAPVNRRQESPPTFDMNASVYVWNYGKFINDPRVFYERTKLYEMPENRSHDIDSELDFKIVEYLLSNN